MLNKIFLLLVIMLGIIQFGCATTSSTPTKYAKVSDTYQDALPLYPAIDSLAAKLVASLAGREAGKIAVADFIGPGSEIHVFGELLADKLGVRLFSSGAFSGYMERKQLKELIRAQAEERQSAYFDQETVKEMGKMIGVDSMVIGSIEDLGTIVDVTARIVQSGTGQVLGMADVQIVKDGTVSSMLRQQRTATLSVNVDPPTSGTVTAGGQTVTLVNGIAILSGIPYGQCSLIIQPNGYEPVRRAIQIRSQNEVFGVRLETTRHNVTFQIVPPDAQLVVEGEKINLSPEGFAKLDGLEGREYGYSISAKGYESRMASFNPAQERLLQINIRTSDPLFAAKDSFFTKVNSQRDRQRFQVKLWTDKTNYRAKESIVFSFSAEEDCYLNLVDINSEGEINLLFPNKFHQDNFVRAGKTYSIPDASYGFRLAAQPPYGTDRIYAIASRQPLRIFSDDYGSGFKSVTRGTRGWIPEAKSIRDRLDEANFDAVAEAVTQIQL